MTRAKTIGAGTVYRWTVVLSSVWLFAHCGTRTRLPTPAQSADVARADALVRDGCYRCLRDALALYLDLIAPADRPLPIAVSGAFGTSLLLAVREKELGLDPEASLARAKTLLSRLAASTPPPIEPRADPSILLEAAEAVTGDQSGLDAEERQQRDDARLQTSDEAPVRAARVRAALAKHPPTDVVAAYLVLVLECEQPRRQPASGAAPLPAQPVDSPLLRYRRAICGGGPTTALAPLREADPRWSEVDYFEGKYEMGSPSRAAEPARAAALLASAADAFPDSIAVRMLLAKAQEMNGEFAASLASFDRVVASKPSHVDARLGRVRNLSVLGRADEGLAAATTLIDAGTWHVGDAYYWRAWNAYQLRRLDAAWTDVQHAMRLLANTSVYALAGSIAYARRDLDTAVRHFDTAFQIDPSNCLATWSSGLVHLDQLAWPGAADRFTKATSCFAGAATSARTDMAKFSQSALDPAVKAHRIDSARKRMESAEELHGQSALNAAQSYVHTGERTLALAYVELAQGHPATRDKALALRSRIDDMR